MGPIWMKNVSNYLWPICGYCKEYKMPAAIMGLICGYCNECKMHATILGLICGYCIFENLLMEFIIENDVGIICLKCVYYFKILQAMWILLYYICTMFILIFGLIFTSQVLRKLWQRRHMINHIPIKQVWVEDNIILIKDVQKWVHEKLLNNPMKKNVGSL
jgi:hypothetical protein